MLVTRPVPFQYLLLHSLTDFHVLVPFDVNIRSHPLNEHQKHTTLLEGRELWLYHLDGEGLKPILLPWKYHKGRSMGFWAKYKNFTKFQFYTENVFKVIPFLWLRSIERILFTSFLSSVVIDRGYQVILRLWSPSWIDRHIDLMLVSIRCQTRWI